MSKICPACKAENSDSASFCTSCGTPLENLAASKENVEWFIHQGKKELGPLSQDEVILLIQKGEISRNDYVWTVGLQDWIPVKNSILAKEIPAKNGQSKKVDKVHRSTGEKILTGSVYAEGVCILVTLLSEAFYSLSIGSGNVALARILSIISAVSVCLFLLFMAVSDWLFLRKNTDGGPVKENKWVKRAQIALNFFPLVLVIWIGLSLFMSI